MPNLELQRVLDAIEKIKTRDPQLYRLLSQTWENIAITSGAKKVPQSKYGSA